MTETLENEYVARRREARGSAWETSFDVADSFVKGGGTHLFIDEVHKYPRWSQELKLMYDSFPGLHVYFAGSSVLDIEKGEADLSRRAPRYAMQGLSFSTGRKLKRLMAIVGTLAPFKPNMTQLAGKIQASRNNVEEYLGHMEHGYGNVIPLWAFGLTY